MNKKITLKEVEKELKKLRNEINKQDRLLFLTLKKRFKIVKKVALLKKKYNLPILQKDRWEVIINESVRLGLKLKIEPDFILSFMKLIHKESIRFQLSFQNKKMRKNE